MQPLALPASFVRLELPALLVLALMAWPMLRGDRRLGVVYTTFDSVGKLLKSRLQVPSGPARLDLEFYDIGPIDTLPPDIWVKPGNNAP